MPSITRVAAAIAAAAALAAASAAPASAQDLSFSIGTNQCVEDLTIPSCVDWTLDTVDRAINTAENVYNAYAREYVCDVNWILTGETCAAPTALAR
jgi:uncharacterized protein YecT (DUF1311 family)